MFAWIGRAFRRIFPPIMEPPRYEPHDYGFTHVITRTVIVNGRKLEGEESDRVSEIVGKYTKGMFEPLDKMFEEIDEALKPKKD